MTVYGASSNLMVLNVIQGIGFWGEYGAGSFRKIMWLAKHNSVQRVVIFQVVQPPAADEIDQETNDIPTDWYQTYDI